MKDSIEDYLEAAVEAAHLGGEILKKNWGGQLIISEKDYPGELVTHVDKESEEAILEYLSGRFPDHGILAEESGEQAGSTKHLWVVDPLDGTTNYTHQHPMVSVSIGLLIDGEPVVGVVLNPIHQELYCGAKGLGATLNGEKIQVSATKSLEKSLLATGFAYDRVYNPDNNLAEFCAVTNLSQGVRRGGSAALDLAYLAAGRLDGFWELGLKPWDLAAGVVLVQEAGSRVTEYDTTPFVLESGKILATNGHIHDELSDVLMDVKSKSSSD